MEYRPIEIPEKRPEPMAAEAIADLASGIVQMVIDLANPEDSVVVSALVLATVAKIAVSAGGWTPEKIAHSALEAAMSNTTTLTPAEEA